MCSIITSLSWKNKMIMSPLINSLLSYCPSISLKFYSIGDINQLIVKYGYQERYLWMNLSYSLLKDAISSSINLLEMIWSLSSKNLILIMMDLSPSNNLLILSGNILEIILILGQELKLKNLKKIMLQHLSLKEFQKNNLLLSMLFGTNLKYTSINMIKEAKDSWMKPNLNLSLLKFSTKLLKDSSTMSSGTCSELTQMPTKKLTSLNLYFLINLGTLHPESCWWDIPPKIPQRTDQGKEQFDWIRVVHSLIKCLQIPFINAQEEISSWCNI